MRNEPTTRPKLWRRAMIAAVSASVIAGAFAIAVAVRKDNCDIESRIPEERKILCELQKSGDPEQCDTETTGLTPEQCDYYLDYFNDKHGGG